MKRSVNRLISNFLMLPLIGFFVHLPVHAQSQTDQNINSWSTQDLVRNQPFYKPEVKNNYTFHSKVINDSSFHSVGGCHIINKTQHIATIADTYGEFRITANINDSISFSNIGYKKLTIALTDSMFIYGRIIRLKPTVYELEEVTVIRYQLNLPKISEYEIPIKPLPNQGGVSLLPTEVNPISFFYNKYSKEARQKRHYNKLIEGTADYLLVGEKFNSELVAQLTGLKDDKLVEFMSYCGFTKDFLLNYSPETIKRAIKKKHTEYVEQF